MKILSFLLLFLTSCSTLMSAGAAGAGAAIGSLAGPGGAAIGGAAGVVAVDLMEEEAPVIEDSPASTIHHTTNLVETVGLWYLLIFVLVPFLTKRGRGWFKNLTQLHDNVSKKEVEELVEELKKQVDSSK